MVRISETDWYEEIFELDNPIPTKANLADVYADVITGGAKGYETLEGFYKSEVKNKGHRGPDKDATVQPWQLSSGSAGKDLNCLGKAIKTALAAEREFEKEVYPIVQYDEGFEGGHVAVYDPDRNICHGCKEDKDSFDLLDSQMGFYALFLSNEGAIHTKNEDYGALEEVKGELEEVMEVSGIDSDYLDARLEEAEEVIESDSAAT